MNFGLHVLDKYDSNIEMWPWIKKLWLYPKCQKRNSLFTFLFFILLLFVVAFCIVREGNWQRPSDAEQKFAWNSWKPLLRCTFGFAFAFTWINHTKKFYFLLLYLYILIGWRKHNCKCKNILGMILQKYWIFEYKNLSGKLKMDYFNKDLQLINSRRRKKSEHRDH